MVENIAQETVTEIFRLPPFLLPNLAYKAFQELAEVRGRTEDVPEHQGGEATTPYTSSKPYFGANKTEENKLLIFLFQTTKEVLKEFPQSWFENCIKIEDFMYARNTSLSKPAAPMKVQYGLLDGSEKKSFGTEANDEQT